MEKDNSILLDIVVFLLTISYCTGMHFMYYIVILYYHLVRTMFIQCIFMCMHFCRMMKVSFHQHDGRNNWSKPACPFISFLVWFYFAFVFGCSCRIPVAQSLFTCVVVFFILFGHCIAFPSIYDFGLPCRYLHVFRMRIMSLYSDTIKSTNKYYAASLSILNRNNKLTSGHFHAGFIFIFNSIV